MPPRMRCLALAWALVAWAAVPAHGFEPLDGCFVADRACPVVSSIRSGANPGGFGTAPGQSYRLLGANRQEASHFQIRIPDAEPRDRWVEVGCGHRVATCEAAPVGL